MLLLINTIWKYSWVRISCCILWYYKRRPNDWVVSEAWPHTTPKVKADAVNECGQASCTPQTFGCLFTTWFYNTFHNCSLLMFKNRNCVFKWGLCYIWIPTMWYDCFKKAYNMVYKIYHMVMWHDYVTMWYATVFPIIHTICYSMWNAINHDIMSQTSHYKLQYTVMVRNKTTDKLLFTIRKYHKHN